MQSPVSARALSAVGLFALLAAVPADAATAYTYSTTIDLLANRTTSFSGPDERNAFTLPAGQPSFLFSPGDSISGTISFVPGQRLQLTDPTGNTIENVVFRLPGEFAPNEFSARMELLDVSGHVIENPRNINASGNGSLIALIDEVTSSTVSFAGFNYSITLNSLLYSTSRTYSPSDLTVVTAPGGLTVVPEPSATAALFAAAAALAGRRRRRIR